MRSCRPFGAEKYTLTSGSSTLSTASATWNPHLPAEDCYEVFAYVPDSFSDNDAATYEVLDQWHGTFWPQVDENAFTSQFVDLGAFMPLGAITTGSNGIVTVTLNDIGPTSPLYHTAADAMEFDEDGTGC